MSEIVTVFKINTIAPRIIADTLVGLLDKGEEKLIINISSNQGVVGLSNTYIATHWPYSASKAALNFSMATFSQVHPTIKSVLINPGHMKTRLGGDNAPLEPKDVANSIFSLALAHKTKLLDGKFFDHMGKEMPIDI